MKGITLMSKQNEELEMDVAQEELRELCSLYREVLWQLNVRPREDCPAIFSTGPSGENIWPPTTKGWTRNEPRVNVRGRSRLLDMLVDKFLRVRPLGGRMFIDENGAFYKIEWEPPIQFVTFRFPNERRDQFHSRSAILSRAAI